MSHPIAFRTARENFRDRMIAKALGVSTQRGVSLIVNSPMGESLREIRPEDWIRYAEVQVVRSRIDAGLDFTDFLITIDTDVEPEATFDIYGEAA